MSSSGPPLRVEMDEVLGRGALSAVSRMALEMEAVSPLLRASTTLNLRTDCSRLADLSLCLGGAGWLEGILLRGEAAESLELLWLRVGACWDMAACLGADLGEAAERPSSEPESSSRVSLRRRSARAAADLERL